MVSNAGICVTKPFLLSKSPVLILLNTSNRHDCTATAEDVQSVVTVNGLGTFLCYKYAAQQMIKQGKGGRIVGASSLAGKQGQICRFLSLYTTHSL